MRAIAAAAAVLGACCDWQMGGVRFGTAAMFDDAPYRVYWGLGSNGWYADPINGGRPGGSGLAYDVAAWGITAFNRSGVGSAGGQAFSIDPGFPQLGNPICERLDPVSGKWDRNPDCHNASNLQAFDPSRGGVPQAVDVKVILTPLCIFH